MCFFYAKLYIGFFFSFPLCCCLLPQQITWLVPALQSQISCPYKQKSQEEGEPTFPDLGNPLSPMCPPNQYPYCLHFHTFLEIISSPLGAFERKSGGSELPANH